MSDPNVTPHVSLLQRILIGRRPKRTLFRALVLATVAAFLFGYVLVPVRISGLSMEPSYHDHSVNLINRPLYLLREPRRGDVVAVGTTGWHIMYCKRIIGLPGETLVIRSGTVFINGQALEEPYVKARDAWEVAPVQLKAGEVFVIGDNRGMEQERHVFGIVERPKLLGPMLW